MASKFCRVAALQMCSGLGVVENLLALDALVAEAVALGAHYILTPEVTVGFPGDKAGLTALAEPFADNKAIAHCAQLAARHGVWLHLGSLAVALSDGRFANRSVLFDPQGEIVATYDKIHLFDADLPGETKYLESATYRAGSEAVVADAAGFKLGMSICYDVRFAALYRMLAEAGSQVIAIPAAFTVPTGRAHWRVLIRARAIETGAFVIAAAQGGQHENGRTTFGHSLIVDPWGKVLAEKTDNQQGVIIADLDLEAVKKARQTIPALANGRVFSLSVNHNR